jgi:hypothetical protein
MATPKQELIRKVIADAGSQFVRVGFVKQNGEQRFITFNPLDFNEIKGTGKASTDPGLIKVREVKVGWRSFRIDRIFSIKANGHEVIFKEVNNVTH